MHERKEIREPALLGLISVNGIRNAEIFIQRIPYESGEVRKRLIQAIVELVKEDALLMTEKIVATFVATERDVQEAGMNIFLNLPNKEYAIHHFLKFCQSIPSFVREQVFLFASEYRDTFADLILVSFKIEKDSELRHLGLKFAKTLKHERLADMFLHELESKDWLVRYTSMLALGEMKAIDAVPFMLAALDEPEISIAAIRALDHYRDVRLAEPLLNKLPSAKKSEQEEIITVLRNMGDKRLIAPLEAFIKKDILDPDVKTKAASCIIELCKENDLEIPPVARVYEGKEEVLQNKLEELPDLKLRITDEVT